MPIETVAILGRQVDALDMSREEFDKAPTYEAGGTARSDLTKSSKSLLDDAESRIRRALRARYGTAVEFGLLTGTRAFHGS